MAIEYVPYNLTPEQVVELWDGYEAGQTVAQLARRFGVRGHENLPVGGQQTSPLVDTKRPH
jgi:hypothetical protein